MSVFVKKNVDANKHSLYNIHMTKNNKQYFFILGINPELSIAEIVSLLKEQSIEFEVDLAIDSVLVIICGVLKDDFFDQLGGSKKFGVIEGQASSLDSFVVSDVLDNQVKDDKFRFGFSFYNFSKADLRRVRPGMHKSGLAYKKELKARGVKSRLVESKDAELSSVIVHKEKMIDHGADIVLVRYKENIFYGRTLAVQDYNAFSARDYGKPSRDATSGMLPPKLARMMLNLATTNKEAVILDPFCGSGTLVLEALALGFENIYGSDKSRVAVDDTERNLIWWQQHHTLDNVPTIQKISIEEMNQHYEAEFVDAIVTEPFLGPPLRGREAPRQIIDLQAQLRDSYKLVLEKFLYVLKPGARVVMVWPVFVDKKQNKIFLNIIESVEALGYEFVNCLTDINMVVEQPTRMRHTYYYCREGQRICREIVVLQKKK